MALKIVAHQEPRTSITASPLEHHSNPRPSNTPQQSRSLLLLVLFHSASPPLTPPLIFSKVLLESLTVRCKRNYVILASRFSQVGEGAAHHPLPEQVPGSLSPRHFLPGVRQHLLFHV